jgi:hypothetical protein
MSISSRGSSGKLWRFRLGSVRDESEHSCLGLVVKHGVYRVAVGEMEMGLCEVTRGEIGSRGCVVDSCDSGFLRFSDCFGESVPMMMFRGVNKHGGDKGWGQYI